ncbi:MAG TPA: DUF6766 family protein [Nocardioidaceae bacterium]|nr:DUF6766 family protein [Nocardioidaceae bacterium]
MTWVRHHSLSLAFGVLLLGSLVGQAFTGQADFNGKAAASAMPTYSWWEYVTSSHFTVDVAENWQSEYLQFLLFILLTVWLIQVGSPESKKPEEAGRESDKDQKVGRYAVTDSPAWAHATGWRLSLFSHSLALTMATIFFGSWVAQLVAGRSAFNAERLMDLQRPLGWGDYLAGPDFWNRTFQNWQSEFLAVATMVVFSIYLRERGSPESKPVGEPHTSTGVEG